jgi:ankyrin repeat protein
MTEGRLSKKTKSSLDLSDIMEGSPKELRRFLRKKQIKLEKFIYGEFNGINPLVMAAEKGNARIVKFILEEGFRERHAPQGSAALEIAVRQGNIEVIKVLLGGDQLGDGQVGIDRAIDLEQFDDLAARQCPYMSGRILNVMAEMKNVEVIKFLVGMNALSHIGANTRYTISNLITKVLEEVEETERYELIKLILEKNPTNNRMQEYVVSKLVDFAIKQKDLKLSVQLFDLFRKKGIASPFGKVENEFPLITAIRNNNFALVDLLVQQKVFSVYWDWIGIPRKEGEAITNKQIEEYNENARKKVIEEAISLAAETGNMVALEIMYRRGFVKNGLEILNGIILGKIRSLQSPSSRGAAAEYLKKNAKLFEFVIRNENSNVDFSKLNKDVKKAIKKTLKIKSLRKFTKEKKSTSDDIGSDAEIYSEKVAVLEPGDLLVEAVLQENVEEVKKLLLERGIDVVNARLADGTTLFSQAVKKGNIEMAELFVSAGAEVDVRLPNGNTPLSLVIESENTDSRKKLDLVEFLVDRSKANFNAIVYDNTGNKKNILDLAIEKGNSDIVKFLVRKKAETYRDYSESVKKAKKKLDKQVKSMCGVSRSTIVKSTKVSKYYISDDKRRIINSGVKSVVERTQHNLDELRIQRQSKRRQREKNSLLAGAEREITSIIGNIKTVAAVSRQRELL